MHTQTHTRTHIFNAEELLYSCLYKEIEHEIGLFHRVPKAEEKRSNRWLDRRSSQKYLESMQRDMDLWLPFCVGMLDLRLYNPILIQKQVSNGSSVNKMAQR